MSDEFVVDDVAARLARLKTPKARRQRIRQIKAQGDGSGYMDVRDAIEMCFLGLQLRNRRVVVTKAMVEDYYKSLWTAMTSGQVRAAVNIDGEHVPLPPRGPTH